jgi:TetR/AcrR family transcriptional repressor of mexJK operon
VKAKCEEQLPELFFELPQGVPIKTVLLNIGRGFHTLINSRESVEMHRLMVALASQNSKLPQMFYDAGPQRLLNEMQRLLSKADQAGQLRIDDAFRAADQFLCLIKGGANFRLLIGCTSPPQGETAEQHVQGAVDMFVRAYRAD